MTRMNSNFADMIIFEQNRAMLIYPPEEAFADMKEPFAYEFPEKEDRIKKISYMMDIENQKALKVLDDILSNIQNK